MWYPKNEAEMTFHGNTQEIEVQGGVIHLIAYIVIICF